MSGSAAQLRVGMIGYGFMGAVHSHAWQAVKRAFDVEAVPVLAVLCGRDRAGVEVAAKRYGFAETATDWREVVKRDDIDVIDICTPGDSHMPVAVDALEAGKHVLCEKPLANSVAEAEAMTLVAERATAAGQRSMVGFNYRRTPAIKLARQLVADGRVGDLRHVRGAYLQDGSWARTYRWRGGCAKRALALVPWGHRRPRDRPRAVLDRRASHGPQRPHQDLHHRATVALGPCGVPRGPGSTEKGEVTVDDAVVMHGEIGPALATFEATRMATGRKNALRIEVNGSSGSLAFDFESMNELWFLDGAADRHADGFRRILATEPSHPYIAAWWPPGHGLGYDHTFTNEIADFVRAIVDGTDPEPSFADGLQIQRVLAAVETSAANDASWTVV